MSAGIQEPVEDELEEHELVEVDLIEQMFMTASLDAVIVLHHPDCPTTRQQVYDDSVCTCSEHMGDVVTLFSPFYPITLKRGGLA